MLILSRKAIYLLEIIFFGISGLLLFFSITWIGFCEENKTLYIIGFVLLFIWIPHLIGFIIFVSFTNWRRQNLISRVLGVIFCKFLHKKISIRKRNPFKLVALAFFVFIVIGFFFRSIILANWEYFDENLQYDSNINNPFMQGYFFVELDYSKELEREIPYFPLCKISYDIFKKIGAICIMLIDDSINESSVRLSSSNMTEYAKLMNDTRDYLFAVHCVILVNGTIEGLDGFWGYAPRNKLWYPAMANFSEPRYCGCLVFYDNFKNPFHLIKVVIHEISHYLGADHSRFGIMKQGSISYLEFFFSIDSQAQMSIYNKWGVEKGFEIYAD